MRSVSKLFGFRYLPQQERMMGDWTFFSNYGHVLVCLARDREARLRDVAIQVGITERAVQKIVRDMQDAGYLEISKHGRRNRYRINNRKALRHPLQKRCTVGQLIQLLNKEPAAKQSPQLKPATVAVDTNPQPSEQIDSRPGSNADKKPTKSDLEQGQLF